MRSSFVVACAPIVLLACGDNGNQTTPPDAHHVDTPMIDAPSMTCEYTEKSDATNDDLFSSTGMPETTNLNFTSTKLTFCGKLDNTHFDAGQQLVDVDSYKVHIPNSGAAKLTLTASGAEDLASVVIEIYDNVSGSGATGQFIGTHAAAAADLVPGDYVVTVSSFHNAAPTTPIAYRLTLSPANLATLCPQVTATANYTEANDLATNTGNDVYEIRYGTGGTTQPSMTALTTDAPENTSTAFSVAPATNYRVSGVSGVITVAAGDAYQDRDTYAITTGASTNELSLRLNWMATTMDLDMFAFRENAGINFAYAYDDSNVAPELMTFAVEPNATYWILVAADNQTTGQPLGYDLSVCGATFTP